MGIIEVVEVIIIKNNKITSNHQKLENNKNPHPNDKSGQGKKKVENVCH